MSQFTVEGILQEDSPAIFDVTITVHSDYDQATIDSRCVLPEEYSLKAIVDTGSRQCLIKPGLFSDRHFGKEPLSCPMSDAMGNQRECRGQKMQLSFLSGTTRKTIEVPIYEMDFGPLLPGGYILIGRSVLNRAVFTYDGPNRTAKLTFPDATLVTL